MDTDKSIIIDGCNVLECEFYQIEANELYPKAQYCGSMRNTFCANEPNCYFKQLQRAKAENEKLHITIEKLKGDLYITEDSLRDYQEHYNKLQAENEKLKDKAYKDADMIYRLTEENREYDIDLSIEKEAHKSNIERLDKYHKALEDIREILCYGRTFYDGYFDSDKLSRTDEAIKRVNEVLND